MKLVCVCDLIVAVSLIDVCVRVCLACLCASLCVLSLGPFSNPQSSEGPPRRAFHGRRSKQWRAPLVYE